MIKKLAVLAAAGILYIAAPTAPASAQGINVQIGNGHRDHGFRDSRARMRRDYGHRHHGWDHRRPRGRTIIVR